jgi:hypothetical protein
VQRWHYLPTDATLRRNLLREWLRLRGGHLYGWKLSTDITLQRNLLR